MIRYSGNLISRRGIPSCLFQPSTVVRESLSFGAFLPKQNREREAGGGLVSDHDFQRGRGGDCDTVYGLEFLA